MKYVFLSILVIAITSSCEEKNTSDNWDLENVTTVDYSSPKVKGAIKFTQEKLDSFNIMYLQFSKDSSFSFFIRTSFTEDKITEHMWCKVLNIDSSFMKVKLDNIPKDIRNYNYKDTLQIKPNVIEDFLILKNDTIILGGYIEESLNYDY